MQPDLNDIPIRDIHLPDPVSWWPPALGWWLVMLLIFALLVGFAWYLKRRKRFEVKKQALRELDELYRRYQHNNDANIFVKDLSVLLRRICISQYPPQLVAGLTGRQWLKYLDSTLSPKKNKSGHKFSDKMGLVLLTAPYTNNVSESRPNVEALHTLALEWVNSLGPKQQYSNFVKNPTNHILNRKGAAHVSV